jgi:hypothetical protein
LRSLLHDLRFDCHRPVIIHLRLLDDDVISADLHIEHLIERASLSILKLRSDPITPKLKLLRSALRLIDSLLTAKRSFRDHPIKLVLPHFSLTSKLILSRFILRDSSRAARPCCEKRLIQRRSLPSLCKRLPDGC